MELLLFFYRDFVEIGGQEFSVLKIYIHASYNQPKFSNDIAIIELDKETNYGTNDAICLPELDEHDMKSMIAVVKRSNSSLSFRKALYSSNNECISYFSQQLTKLTPGQFCANVLSNETAFSSFVGAVAIESDNELQYSVKGFTSTSIQTQAFDESKPYIFSDVAQHLNWIKAAIGDEMSREKHKRRKKNSTQDSEPTPRNLRSCQKQNGVGFCVKLNQCSLYRDAPKPFSKQRESYLDEIKCFTSAEVRGNSVREDGICCDERYIALEPNSNESIGQRFHGKRGVELVNPSKCGQVDPTRRIVGGSKADLKEFPWIGIIKYKTGRIFKFTCGSSLISSKYLVTCAVRV